MKYEFDLTQDFEQKQRATARLAFAVSTDTRLSNANDPLGEFSRRGWSRYAPSAKAAVDAITTQDTAVALLPLSTAFLREVGQATIDGRLDGALRLPLNAAARLQVGSVEATEVAEGETKPVVRLTFTAGNAPLQKVVGEIVVSVEALRAFDVQTQSGVRQLLVDALAAASDRVFVAALTAVGTSIGTATAGALLAAISSGAPSRPYLVGGLDELLSLTPGTLRDLRDLNVGILPSPAAQGLLIAVDATGVLIGEAPPDVQTARHASMVLDDGGSPQFTTSINLWQGNLSAIRAERFVRFTVRPEAVAYAAVIGS